MAQVIHTDPVTCTFRASEWHALSRDLVYVATHLEKCLDALERDLDPRRDAMTLAWMPQMRPLVDALDAAVELLMDAQARPVPGPGGR